jgi:Spy/CpxP family protein refolding chaperone
MNFRRTHLSLICFATLLGGAASASAAIEPGTPNAAPTPRGPHHGWGGPDRGFQRVLGQLDLTAEQKSRIQALVVQATPAMQATQQSGRANRDQLLITPPTDPAYPGLLAFAKSNAAELIQQMSDLWAQVYGELTPDQRAQIPGIVASASTERDSRKASRRAQKDGP